MRVLVLGGTGVIGSAVVRELIARGHTILGLARSEASVAKLTACGAASISGDIAAPERWAGKLREFDAVIHAACDFDGDMAGIDDRLLNTLLPALATQGNRPRFVYTGGCWLFGSTGEAVATETTPFDPLPAFAWMVPNLKRVLAAPAIDGIVIHPAMVHADDGGVFQRFARDAADRHAVRVVTGEAVRWPLVHADDLASLYALALERAPAGSSYIGAANDGIAVGQIARAFAKRFGTRDQEPEIVPVEAVAAELGEWARGYARDQRLSGGKARRELLWRPAHLDPIGEISSSVRNAKAAEPGSA